MSKDIKLVKFERKYISPKYINWLNDKKLVKYSEQRFYEHSYESCYDYYKSFLGTPNLFFAVIDESTKEHVGNITAIVDTYNSAAKMAILIAKGNNNYGFMAWSKMIKILFNEKKVRKIFAGTVELNIPMIKIFQKCNMEEEYRKKKQFIIDGKEVDEIGYCIFNKHYHG